MGRLFCGVKLEVDVDKCTGDEECVNVCPAGVLEMDGDKANPANVMNVWAASPAWRFAPRRPSP